MGFTTAVVKQDDKILLFDSHSRCPNGLQTASGKAVVMEASSVEDFALYVRRLTKSLTKSLHRDTVSLHVPFEVVSVNSQELI